MVEYHAERFDKAGNLKGQSGPHDSREAAEVAGRALWPQARFSIGYGRGGAYFDIRSIRPEA